MTSNSSTVYSAALASALFALAAILFASPAYADSWSDQWRDSPRRSTGPTIYTPPPVYQRPYESPAPWQVERTQPPPPVVVVPRPETPRSGFELNQGSDALRREWR